MSPMLRRAAARAVLVAGVAAIAIWLARDCESGEEGVTIVVDPAPMGEGVRAIRVDLFDDSGARGSLERRYRPGEGSPPVRLRSAAPGPGAELHVEVETDDGLRRVRRPIEVAPGGTVTVRLGAGDVTR